MASTQYIGARYVPKFYENSDGNSEWRSNVTYEPLTIVTWNLNSYTSKKAVPSTVGNPSDNPDYWVSTGNYNAYIDEINTEIDALTAFIDEIKANSGIVNVKDYGAKGDGVTNDTTAIAAAFTAAKNAGKSLYFPSGTYISKNHIFLGLVTGLTIFGDGYNSKIIHTHDDNYPLFFETETSADISIHDLNIESDVTSRVIWVRGTHCDLYNCYIKYTGNNTAITVTGESLRIYNNFITCTDESSAFAITVESYGGDDGVHYSVNSIIENNHINVGYKGIRVRKLAGNQVEGLTITGNTILGQGAGVGTSANIGISLEGEFVCIISDNIIDQFDIAIYLHADVWSNLSIQIDGNYLGALVYSIYTDSTGSYANDYVTLNNNTLLASGSSGVAVQNLPSSKNKNFSITNCRITSKSIALMLYIQNFIAANNLIVSDDSTYAYIHEATDNGPYIFDSNLKKSGTGILGDSGIVENTNYFNSDKNMHA